MLSKWILCFEGRGYYHEHGYPENRIRIFKVNSVGLVKEILQENVVVWLIGSNEIWTVTSIDVLQTGDPFEKKICNICHCLLPISQFDKNQNNKYGVVHRPNCIRCRTDIDKRAPKSQQAKQMEKQRPKTGSYFKCPICRKRSIVGITAKIVADHDHHTGNIRDFIS